MIVLNDLSLHYVVPLRSTDHLSVFQHFVLISQEATLLLWVSLATFLSAVSICSLNPKHTTCSEANSKQAQLATDIVESLGAGIFSGVGGGQNKAKCFKMTANVTLCLLDMLMFPDLLTVATAPWKTTFQLVVLHPGGQKSMNVSLKLL